MSNENRLLKAFTVGMVVGALAGHSRVLVEPSFGSFWGPFVVAALILASGIITAKALRP